MEKLLIASYNLDFGGIEKSLINLLKNIDYDKYKITLVLEKKEGVFLNDVPKSVLIKEYKVSKNNNILFRKVSNIIKRLKWILFNYKRYDASICYTTYSLPCGFVARVSSNNKVLFVHSNYYRAYDKNANKTIKFFNEIKIEKYSKVIFVSNESKNDLCTLIPKIEKKCVTINNLIDYDEIITLSKKRIDIKKDKKKVFLFVGRLEESSKRLSLLLQTAKKCMINNDNALFWLVGSGPDEKKYKLFAKKNKLNNVAFLGAQQNPYPYIKKCDYLILTSKYEGFPVVYNEAIALEKPIVTTIDVSDDYISIPNRFGFIVNEDNLYERVKELSKKKVKMEEKVDFYTLNKKRIDAIERIIGGSNG